MTLIDRRKGSGEWVFVDGGGRRLRAEYVSKKVKSYMRELNLPEELHFHSLRATCASWGLREGVSPSALKDLLGHASVRTTEIYASLDDATLRREVQKIALPAIV
jgi:site-specific recombinase XerD